MGESFTCKCSKCDYSKESSGKLDWGFVATVEPHICNDCHELTDVIVGEHGDRLPLELMSDELKQCHLKCGESKSTNLTVWNVRSKPCPKCGLRMKKDPYGPARCWN